MTKTYNVILDKWIKAVNQKDVKTLINLYAKDAVLLPTFSNRFLNTPKKIKTYFQKLAKLKKLKLTLHKNTLTSQKLRNDIILLSGIYKWSFSIEKELLVFEARFTYVIDMSLGKILHHHSSQVPRTLQ